MYLSLVFAVLVGLYMRPGSVGASPAPVDGEFLVKYRPELKMPDSCAGQNYCFDKGSNYPDEKIERLLHDMRALKVENPEARTSIGSRSGADSYHEPDCASKSTEKPIYYITDTNDKVRVVVQSPEKFQQIYSVKWCLNEGRITKDTPHFLERTTLKKYNIECVSTKMNFDFFVLSDKVDPETKKPLMETATVKDGIPVCCRCRYNAED